MIPAAGATPFGGIISRGRNHHKKVCIQEADHDENSDSGKQSIGRFVRLLSVFLEDFHPFAGAFVIGKKPGTINPRVSKLEFHGRGFRNLHLACSRCKLLLRFFIIPDLGATFLLRPCPRQPHNQPLHEHLVRQRIAAFQARVGFEQPVVQLVQAIPAEVFHLLLSGDSGLRPVGNSCD